jgi:hypothetical protein
MYNIVDIDTGAVIERLDAPPETIPQNTVLVQDSQDQKTMATTRINELASSEIALGYIDENGILFGLSKADQLNYTATASIVNMGTEEITIIGELGTEKYHEVTMENDTAKAFFEVLFSYVSSILSKYRGFKKRILEADDAEVEGILEEAEQSFRDMEAEHASKIG